MYKPSTYYDYDLFIFTSTVKIHIATGGAEIPWSLINLTKNNPAIYEFYSKFENEEIEVNSNLQDIVYRRQFELNRDFSVENYLRSFEKFARYGFYSFDKTNISNTKDASYHLVAYPKNQNFEKVSQFIETQENQKILGRRHFMDPLIKEIASLNFQPIQLMY
ncbi:hypothetical protein [Flavobacterium subsaxonicum]|uniref:Uncharacterized protein n=1 Tax=Flavobacterium subsaxonicum WB 4.1-42 = DSM 21790 TaxID=1121898 RepID=A0A0A2MG56_9FLAO|nr:hypothetical protein [Flavobacterium subsaxonicum]KGO91244.1 hypothetical protein Q766_18990 [Flavobacterium subsaxonicum WB 4.1-42 = DSM 21790]